MTNDKAERLSVDARLGKTKTYSVCVCYKTTATCHWYSSPLSVSNAENGLFLLLLLPQTKLTVWIRKERRERERAKSRLPLFLSFTGLPGLLSLSYREHQSHQWLKIKVEQVSVCLRRFCCYLFSSSLSSSFDRQILTLPVQKCEEWGEKEKRENWMWWSTMKMNCSDKQKKKKPKEEKDKSSITFSPVYRLPSIRTGAAGDEQGLRPLFPFYLLLQSS